MIFLKWEIENGGNSEPCSLVVRYVKFPVDCHTKIPHGRQSVDRIVCRTQKIIIELYICITNNNKRVQNYGEQQWTTKIFIYWYWKCAVSGCQLEGKGWWNTKHRLSKLMKCLVQMHNLESIFSTMSCLERVHMNEQKKTHTHTHIRWSPMIWNKGAHTHALCIQPEHRSRKWSEECNGCK